MKKHRLIAIVLATSMLPLMASCTKSDDDEPTPVNPDNLDEVRVTTYTPQDITSTSVVCGGDVLVTQGLSLNELGVCWSIGLTPTVEDTHLSTTTWNEPFVCTITGLEPNTVYHVRAYALRGLEYYYGETKNFTTEAGNGGGGFNGHEYVDLGLPSGTLWATCNVGATTPEGYGDYFAWGETQQKNYYDWSTYQYCMGSPVTLTKYCSRSNCGYNYYYDDLYMLEATDDAATVNWGNGWCTPTKEQWEELYYSTNNTWSTQNGVNGRLFTSISNFGRSLFLPAAGVWWAGAIGVDNTGVAGRYWSVALYQDPPFNAWYYGSDEYSQSMDKTERQYGLSVRPVRSTP